MAKSISYLLPTLNYEQVVSAVNAKHPGVFRRITWVTDEVTIDDTIITITKTATVRIGVRYDNLKSVIARKASEDEAIGAPKVRRESSYTRFIDTTGKFVEPVFIVRDRKTEMKKFLQVFTSNAKHNKTIERFYKNGVEINDAPLIEKVMAARKIKHSHGPIETWVLPLNKIIEIK